MSRSPAIPYSARPESEVAEPSAITCAAQTIAIATPPHEWPITCPTSVAKKPTGFEAIVGSPTVAGMIVVDSATTTIISNAPARSARAASRLGSLYSAVKVAAISVPYDVHDATNAQVTRVTMIVQVP